MPVLLDAGALTIRRGRRTVLSGVALTVDPGRAIHVAGPNRSGKTSLLRVLAGLAAPRAGTLRRHAACAFVPEKVRLAPALRCGEWLRAMRALRGLTATDWDAATGASGLDPAVLDRPAATLSRGMLQRVALLEALQAGCPLLLLDEPFSGLDDDGRASLAAQVAERLEAGAAVLLTDHSGSAAGRVALTDVLRLRDGAAHRAGVPRAATPRTIAAPDAAVTVRAIHADGRAFERTVPAPASDDLLRAPRRGLARGGPVMTARLRYLTLTAARTRAALPPLAATLFLVIGVYAYRDNDPGSSFAVTSLMACGLAAWAVGAVLAGEPDAQSDMATTALGGRGARAGLEAMLVLAVAALLTVVFLAYPLGLVAVGVGNEFDPAVRAGDVVAAGLGHLSCATLGGAVGVLFAPPRLTRRATAIAAVIAALLALVAVSAAVGPVGGPVAFAQAETDAPAGTVTGAVLVACASCLVLAGALVAAATRWAERSG